MRFLALLLCSAVGVSAQSPLSVVQAEKAFAAYAITHNTKSAFLQFADSAAVVFDKGKAINALECWQHVPDGKGKLLWHPAFFAMAASQDIGFTTGPYEFRKTMDDTAIASGQYTTVWKKQPGGEWKFLVDIGIDYSISQYNKQAITEAPPLTSAKDTGVWKIEQQFIQQYTLAGSTAYSQVTIPASWFNMNQLSPVRGTQQIMKAISNNDLIQYMPVAGGMSAAKDLAYIYGTTLSGGKTENYLRIWGYTDKGWIILVQVVR